MEAETSHDLPSANWKTSKQILQFSQRPRKLEEVGGWWPSCGVSPTGQEPRAWMSEGRSRGMTQLKQKERIHFSLICLLYSSPEWIRWCPLKLVKGYSLLNPLRQMLISSRDTHRTDTLRNKVLPGIWTSLSSIRLTHRLNHHSASYVCLESQDWKSWGLIGHLTIILDFPLGSLRASSLHDGLKVICFLQREFSKR